jgi:hypothetical protein
LISKNESLCIFSAFSQGEAVFVFDRKTTLVFSPLLLSLWEISLGSPSFRQAYPKENQSMPILGMPFFHDFFFGPDSLEPYFFSNNTKKVIRIKKSKSKGLIYLIYSQKLIKAIIYSRKFIKGIILICCQKFIFFIKKVTFFGIQEDILVVSI